MLLEGVMPEVVDGHSFPSLSTEKRGHLEIWSVQALTSELRLCILLEKRFPLFFNEDVQILLQPSSNKTETRCSLTRKLTRRRARTKTESALDDSQTWAYWTVCAVIQSPTPGVKYPPKTKKSTQQQHEDYVLWLWQGFFAVVVSTSVQHQHVSWFALQWVS